MCAQVGYGGSISGVDLRTKKPHAYTYGVNQPGWHGKVWWGGSDPPSGSPPTTAPAKENFDLRNFGCLVWLVGPESKLSVARVLVFLCVCARFIFMAATPQARGPLIGCLPKAGQNRLRVFFVGVRHLTKSHRDSGHICQSLSATPPPPWGFPPNIFPPMRKRQKNTRTQETVVWRNQTAQRGGDDNRPAERCVGGDNLPGFLVLFVICHLSRGRFGPPKLIVLHFASP